MQAKMSPRQPTNLLTIPPELRLQIYEYVFAEWNIEARHTGSNKPPRQVLVVPPLIQVCRLLRNESTDTFDKRMAAALVEKDGAKWFANMCYAELSENYSKRT